MQKLVAFDATGRVRVVGLEGGAALARHVARLLEESPDPIEVDFSGVRFHTGASVEFAQRVLYLIGPEYRYRLRFTHLTPQLARSIGIGFRCVDKHFDEDFLADA